MFHVKQKKKIKIYLTPTKSITIKNIGKMKLEVKTAMSTQTAMPEIGRAEKKQYFLTIGEGEEMITMNVGEKTHMSVLKMTEKKK